MSLPKPCLKNIRMNIPTFESIFPLILDFVEKRATLDDPIRFVLTKSSFQGYMSLYKRE